MMERKVEKDLGEGRREKGSIGAFVTQVLR